MKKIVIYDDDSGLAEGYVERVRKLSPVKKKSFSIDCMPQEVFDSQMDVLRERQKAARKKEGWGDGSIDVDKISIFIVDFDLINTSSFLTGEEVAYVVRCFSKCGLIIGLNLESRKRVFNSYFDLTLKGHPESFCDLNIDAAQLDNLGLWTDERRDFRPWNWPQLPEYLDLMEQKINSVIKNLEKPIAQVLQFNEILQLFSGEALEFLGGDPEKVTFKDFVLYSGNGLRGRDKTSDENIPRIAAARISKWLERLILPGQDILVDAPHLVTRFPSLLAEDHEDLSNWNKTTSFTKTKLPLDFEKLDDFSFKNDFWLSRPAWFWNRVYTNNKIMEVKEPWKSEEPKFAFCEDSSTFEKKELCKEFYATFESPYNQRFVHAKQFKDVDYAPKVFLIQ